METKKILWTASSVSVPPALLEGLKAKGCEVLITNGSGGRPADQVRRILPKVWVTEVGPDYSKFAEVLDETISSFPDVSVIVLSSDPTVEEAVKVMRAGASEYVASGVEPERLMSAIENCLSRTGGRQERRRADLYRRPRNLEIVAKDPAMKMVLEYAQKAAAADATVLIHGESGVGKEVLARFIHSRSKRSGGPFVAINCAALPENLLESELFGHEKGAFTGAVSRKQGKFELADGGTLLLDEISEMAPSIQAKLLRALQERQIDRVGGRYPVHVDVRGIATTNRDLEKEVSEGNFRLDLFYRLNVVPLRIPPLRQRKADIVALAEVFLAREAVERGCRPKTLDDGAKALIESYQWPGNVRELENLFERISIFVESDVVSKADVEKLLRMAPGFDGSGLLDANLMTLKEMEKKMILNALKSHNGNRTHAAKMLGISVRTLRNKLKEYKNQLDTPTGELATNH